MSKFIEVLKGCNPLLSLSEDELEILNLELQLKCKKMLVRFKERKRIIEKHLVNNTTSPIDRFVLIMNYNEVITAIPALENNIKLFQPI